MPQLNNQTDYCAEVVPMIDRSGRNVAVVIAKGTYRLDPKSPPVLASEQKPILLADEYVADPATSDIRIPSDLVDEKPATDVIVIRPAQPLEKSPLYGRTVSLELGPVRVSARIGKEWPLGPVRRDKKPRSDFAGTYDQAWIDNRMPLLPDDFDPRHNQAAPPRQIAPGYLCGNEHVQVTDLFFDSGRDVQFDLPGRVVVVAGNVMNRYFTEVAVLDTVLIWSDKPQITLVWRHVIHPRQKIPEVRNVHVYLTRLRTARELFGAP